MTDLEEIKAHRRAFADTEYQLRGRMTTKSYFHDLDKFMMVNAGIPKTIASKFHRLISRHHESNGKIKDPISAVIDWESTRFTRPDKPLNARETYKKYYNHIDIGDTMNMPKFINSPTAAFKAVYDEDPPMPLFGRTFSLNKKTWNGLVVDGHLKDSWLESLNNLPLEIKSTEEGKGPLRPAHVGFRMKEGEDNMAPLMLENLKKRGFKVYSDIGFEGRPRIIVAAVLTPEDGVKWNQWWENLPMELANSYSKTKASYLLSNK